MLYKKRKCSYKNCGGRRVHFERPDLLRPHQYVNVPHHIPDEIKVYCSIECRGYDLSSEEPESDH